MFEVKITSLQAGSRSFDPLNIVNHKTSKLVSAGDVWGLLSTNFMLMLF